MSLISIAQGVLAEAKNVLSLESSVEPQQFLSALEKYLTTFDEWRLAGERDQPPAADPERANYRAVIEELNGLHARISAVVEEKKDQIRAKMGDIKRRTQIVKTYIDRYPSRVTIAGRRQG